LRRLGRLSARRRWTRIAAAGGLGITQRRSGSGRAPQTKQTAQQRAPGATAAKSTNQGIEATVIHMALFPARGEVETKMRASPS